MLFPLLFAVVFVSLACLCSYSFYSTVLLLLIFKFTGPLAIEFDTRNAFAFKVVKGSFS